MRRVACIALPEIRVEIARERETAAPASRGSFAVVMARQGRRGEDRARRARQHAPRRRVARGARASGSAPGRRWRRRGRSTPSFACASWPRTRSRRRSRAWPRSALAFGPASAFDVTSDVVWVEIGGCAHLHGGEAELARVARGAGRRRSGTRAAWRWRTGRASRRRSRGSAVRAGRGPSSCRRGTGRRRCARCPSQRSRSTTTVRGGCADLGLRRCGDLQKLPRRSLGTRLGRARARRDAAARRRRPRAARRVASARGARRACGARMGRRRRSRRSRSC